MSVRIPPDSERSSLIRIEGDPQGVQQAKRELLELASRMVSPPWGPPPRQTPGARGGGWGGGQPWTLRGPGGGCTARVESCCCGSSGGCFPFPDWCPALPGAGGGGWTRTGLARLGSVLWVGADTQPLALGRLVPRFSVDLTPV